MNLSADTRYHAILFDKLRPAYFICRFFPSVYYMASSKVAIATFGNLAFALALCLYRLVTQVSHVQSVCKLAGSQVVDQYTDSSASMVHICNAGIA